MTAGCHASIVWQGHRPFASGYEEVKCGIGLRGMTGGLFEEKICLEKLSSSTCCPLLTNALLNALTNALGKNASAVARQFELVDAVGVSSVDALRLVDAWRGSLVDVFGIGLVDA